MAVACAVCAQMASGFISGPSVFARGTLSVRNAAPAYCETILTLRMSEAEARSNSERRHFLERAAQTVLGGAALFTPTLAHPSAALAAKGEWARMDMTGKKGVSGLGENDLPAAGKIDPYDNREQANAEYAVRMQDPARIAQKREETIALKEKIMRPVCTAIEGKDWKEAKTILTRDTLPLRRAMNEVSTKGARAVSAAQRGGDPEKKKSEVEKAEKEFLMSVNRLAVALDGERSKVDFGKAEKAALKVEQDWGKWLALSTPASAE